WTGREEAMLERWREEAATNGRASTGWEQTLEAASEGRVDLLLVQSGVEHPAYECPKCGRAQLTDGSCPIDGTAMENRDTGQVIREHRDLEPVGGLAALLLY